MICDSSSLVLVKGGWVKPRSRQTQAGLVNMPSFSQMGVSQLCAALMLA